MAETIPMLRQIAAAKERRAVLTALNRSGWLLGKAAEILKVAPASLQRLLDTHDLRHELAAHGVKRGRPKKGLK